LRAESGKLCKNKSMSLFAKFLITPAVLLASALFFEGVMVESIFAALVVAVLLGLINLTVRPFLVVLSLPITILTFGLFILVINATILWFVALFVEGLSFVGFIHAFITALIISIAHWLGDRLVD